VNARSLAPADLRRAYGIAGLAIDVNCAEPGVAAAVDLRLRGGPLAAGGCPDLRLEFAVAQRPVLPVGRTVYETPAGAILYDPENDVVGGRVGEVVLRCEPDRGRLRIEAGAYLGAGLYAAAHPLATIGLIELLKRRSRFNLHAACVARDGRGVLLAGPSGAGKSTLALALVRAGLDFLGDDMVFLTPADGSIRALGFPDAVGVTADTAARFPELGDLDPPADGFPKRLVRIEDVFAGRLAADCDPVALVFPEVVRGGRSRLVSLDPAAAWLRLVPDVLLTEPGATGRHLGVLAGLLDQVTCHGLESGADLRSSAALVAGLL
jgi:hypothetical protein